LRTGLVSFAVANGDILRLNGPSSLNQILESRLLHDLVPVLERGRCLCLMAVAVMVVQSTCPGMKTGGPKPWTRSGSFWERRSAVAYIARDEFDRSVESNLEG